MKMRYMESIYNDVIKGRFIRPFLFGSRKNILSVEANIDEKEGCIYLHFDYQYSIRQENYFVKVIRKTVLYIIEKFMMLKIML